MCIRDSLSTASNLSAGNYYVIVTDIYSGCQDSINFDIIEATPIQLSISGSDVSCNEQVMGLFLQLLLEMDCLATAGALHFQMDHLSLLIQTFQLEHIL